MAAEGAVTIEKSYRCPSDSQFPDSDFLFLQLGQRKKGRTLALFLKICTSLPTDFGLNFLFQKKKPIKDLTDHLNSAIVPPNERLMSSFLPTTTGCGCSRTWGGLSLGKLLSTVCKASSAAS